MTFSILEEKIHPSYDSYSVYKIENQHYPAYDYDCVLHVKLKTLEIEKYEVKMTLGFFYTYLILEYKQTQDVKEKMYIRKMENCLIKDNDDILNLEGFILKRLINRNKKILSFHLGV